MKIDVNVSPLSLVWDMKTDAILVKI